MKARARSAIKQEEIIKMNYRNLLQAILFPVFVFVINWFFGLIGFDAGGDLANQLASLIVSALLTWFLGDTAAALMPRRFK
jgi:membrane associated rhomboid family serine protease